MTMTACVGAVQMVCPGCEKERNGSLLDEQQFVCPECSSTMDFQRAHERWEGLEAQQKKELDDKITEAARIAKRARSTTVNLPLTMHFNEWFPAKPKAFCPVKYATP